MRRLKGWHPHDALTRFLNDVAPCNATFTINDLSRHNGSGGQPAYFSAAGVVYDVTGSPSFQSSYKAWVGKDASYSLAIMSIDPKHAGRTDWGVLGDKEHTTLSDWSRYFRQKYRVVGRLEEWNGHFSVS
eukprot:Sspe_Gene.23651::Locus_9223_Transcript_1_1_Confidence_1.000_Length_639::g.23651::m.23651